ncbi:MAG: hypothetical protein IJ097_01475 [Bacilli bacterium]|nr:hypothetical protein [Bacilli bacterium]
MKKYIEAFRELKKKPYGKSVVFFGFYLILFIFLAIIFSLSSKRNITSNDYNKFSNNIIHKYLSNSDYSFDYKVNVDKEEYNYFGNKNKGEYSFIYKDIKYYIIDDKCYTKTNGEKEEIVNPMKFNMFVFEKDIDNIMKSSYLESKISYDDGKKVYNYLISTNTLNLLFDNKNTDYEEIPNRISVSIDDKKVESISYDLSSYCKLNSLCTDSLKINITYEFNE